MTERRAQKVAESMGQAIEKARGNCRYVRAFVDERLLGVADVQMVVSACTPEDIKRYLKLATEAASYLTTFTTKLKKLARKAR